MPECESWQNIGKRIRKLRKENRLTLKQLAAGCELSPNTISLVERGEVAPTVVTLCKVAHTLGVSASAFFHDICPTEVILTRAAQYPAADSSTTPPAAANRELRNLDDGAERAERSRSAAGMQVESQTESAFQLLAGRERPGSTLSSDHGSCNLPAQVNQMVLCVCGQMECEVDDQCYLLYPGDSLSFNSQAFHRWRNTGAKAGIAVMVVGPEPRSHSSGG